MESFSAFLEMGGYGAYVWPSFGVSAVLMVAVALQSIRALKASEAAFKALERSQSEGFDEAQT